jgi:hypothetical protein
VPISKRTRFEVLRRDDHHCRYCGASADDNPLTIDHVTPVALGGSDDPSNLVAACKDCNAGKTSTSPDEHIVAQVADDALRWAAAMAEAARNARAERSTRATELQPWCDEWNRLARYNTVVPDDWESSLRRWLDAGLTIDDLVDLIPYAHRSHISRDKSFRYYAGCVRNTLQQRAEEAKKLLGEAPPSTCPSCELTPCCEVPENCDHASPLECARDIGNQAGWSTGFQLAKDRWAWHDEPRRMLVGLVDLGYHSAVAYELTSKRGNPWLVADPSEQVA